MVIVFVLLVSMAPSLLGQNDGSFAVENVAASPSAQANNTETMWFDTYSSNSPPITNYSTNPLDDGITYTITIEGTFSLWSASTWLQDPQPVGPFENAPMYPSLAGDDRTGRVGEDAYWGFACVQDWYHGQPLPSAWACLQISLDSGASWDGNKRPVDDVYNPLHKYELMVIGEGNVIGFRLYDEAIDNYGMFKIVISPSLDTDGDGLLDEWEQNGVDGDSDGTVDLVLQDADWQHKDIFVEVDYMDLCKPDPLAINDAKIAFSKAPVGNPDEKNGINLHVLVDQEIPRDLSTTWENFDNFKQVWFGTAEDQASSNKAAILEARKQISHYCLFAFKFSIFNKTTQTWKLPGNSGIGERPGNDFMVTLGYTFESNPHYLGRMEQASTFMHELGHNLNLRHGGKDDINFKPNYLSIMNYMFQFNYLYPNRPLDFSRTELSTLNEAALNEIDGVEADYASADNGGWLFTGYKDPIKNETVLSLLRPIDWDGDNFYNASVRANVNNCTDLDLEYKSRPDQMLIGFNDWDNIVLPFQNSKNFEDGAHYDCPEEMTLEAMELMKESAQNYHDVAPLSATPSAVAVDRSSNLDINVTIANLGPNNETTSLSIYAGTELMVTRTITLERSSIVYKVLRCDISSVGKGRQPVIVVLGPVPGEMSSVDNNFTYGAIDFTGEAATQTTDQPWSMILGVSVAVVAVISIALFFVLRKGGKKSS